jgi:hypothetical protein
MVKTKDKNDFNLIYCLHDLLIEFCTTIETHAIFIFKVFVFMLPWRLLCCASQSSKEGGASQYPKGYKRPPAEEQREIVSFLSRILNPNDGLEYISFGNFIC